MPTFVPRYTSMGYVVWLNGEIGPILTGYEVNVIVNWLNNTRLTINSYSLFSYEIRINEKFEEVYQIQDGGKPIGDAVTDKRDVVAIVTWLNSCISELKHILEINFYEPIIGDDPTDAEIRSYMKYENVGYYDALESMRKKRYKKL